MADVVAHMQITSCYHGTASCPEREQGPSGPNLWGGAVFRTHLDFIQLDPRNGWCHVTSTPDTQYTITDDVHHFLSVAPGSTVTFTVDSRPSGIICR